MVQLAIADEGVVAAFVVPERIVVLRLPSGEQLGELDFGPVAAGEARRIAWLGNRLLVVTRHAASTELAIVEPARTGVREIARRHEAGALELAAVVGDRAVLVGEHGAQLISANGMLQPGPSDVANAIVATAGDQLVIARGDAIEEWDPSTRVGRRRWRVSGPLVALGGSPRVLWSIAAASPTRLDVLPLVHLNQPRHRVLPQPFDHVASDPQHDLIAGLAAGRVYLVDLDGDEPPHDVAFELDAPIAAVALGRGRSHLVVVTELGTIASFALDATGHVLR